MSSTPCSACPPVQPRPHRMIQPYGYLNPSSADRSSAVALNGEGAVTVQGPAVTFARTVRFPTLPLEAPGYRPPARPRFHRPTDQAVRHADTHTATGAHSTNADAPSEPVRDAPPREPTAKPTVVMALAQPWIS